MSTTSFFRHCLTVAAITVALVGGFALAQEKAKAPLLDDEDVKKPAAPAAKADEKKPATPPKPAPKGGLLDDEDDAKTPPKPAPPKPAGKPALLDDDDDIKNPPKPTPPKPQPTTLSDGTKVTPAVEGDPHTALYAEDNFPSASKCAACHQQIYDEWRVSNHAYASISPMFHKFEQKINDLAQGTIGYFCMRCHASVGTALKEERDLPLWKRTKVSREGITCITCHRVESQYVKVNGERRIEEGNIHKAVLGTSDGSGLADAIKNITTLDPKGDKTGPAIKVHAQAIKFEQLNKSEFCVSCHQVAVNIGIKLEVVWDQYRASPAAKKGTQCQDCHMGHTPGVAAGYAEGPAAVVAGKPTAKRKHANHSFYGPGYPIAHPGIFPHNPKAEKWTMEQWLKFDFRAGWGTAAFEEKVDKGTLKITFPDVWKDSFDREDARAILDENIKLLEKKRKDRLAVMENSSRIDGPFFNGNPTVGRSLSFQYKITNTDDGHNMPSGSLGAQPEIWFNVALIDPDGKNVWETGYVDSHGDMADLHSFDVRAGKLAHDDQLVNLQSKFLTTNIKGTDREMYLPVNVDADQIPFLRPAGTPTTVINHPPTVRMEARSIPPLGVRKANYSVPANLLTKPGKYKLACRLRSRAEPIYFMKFVGATKEMEQSMNEWMIDIHPYTVEFEVK